MAAVLKTVSPKGLRGSNPLPSAKRNAAGRVSDRLFLASGPSKARFRKGWKTKTASWPVGPTAAFYALQGPAASGEGCRRRRNPGGGGIILGH